MGIVERTKVGYKADLVARVGKSSDVDGQSSMLAGKGERRHTK